MNMKGIAGILSRITIIGSVIAKGMSSELSFFNVLKESLYKYLNGLKNIFNFWSLSFFTLKFDCSC